MDLQILFSLNINFSLLTIFPLWHSSLSKPIFLLNLVFCPHHLVLSFFDPYLTLYSCSPKSLILSWKRILQDTSTKEQLIIWLWSCSCFVSSPLSTGLSSMWESFGMTTKPINWPGNPRESLVCIYSSCKTNKRIWCLKYVRADFLKWCPTHQVFSAWNGGRRGIRL